MKIGLDVDGVLLDFVTPFWKFHNENHNTDIDLSKVVKSDYYFADFLGISREEEKKRMTDFFNHNYFYDLKPIIGSQEIVEKLSKKHSLYVITSREDSWRTKTIKSLDKHFKDKFNQVFFTGNYKGLNVEKADICLDLNIDLLVDDHLANVLGCSKVGVNSLLYDASHNGADLPANVNRVYSWEDIFNKIEGKLR